jgi:hypothetical protein
MNGCPIDEATLSKLRAEIEAVPPRPHHSTLHEAVARVLPGQSFRFALTRGGWYRPGGVIRPNGDRVTDDLEAWAEAELEACDGDMDEFLDRHGQDGLYTTRHSGRTHYFVAPYGPGPADFLQLEVEELREVLDRHLVSPDAIPTDLEELTDPLNPALLGRPAGGPRPLPVPAPHRHPPGGGPAARQRGGDRAHDPFPGRMGGQQRFPPGPFQRLLDIGLA